MAQNVLVTLVANIVWQMTKDSYVGYLNSLCVQGGSQGLLINFKVAKEEANLPTLNLKIALQGFKVYGSTASTSVSQKGDRDKWGHIELSTTFPSSILDISTATGRHLYNYFVILCTQVSKNV